MSRPDGILFSIAFLAYLLGFFGYIAYTALKRENIGRIATLLMIIGIVPHTLAFIIRWTAQGHYPLANMYEYMGLMAWMVVLGLLYFIYRYKNPRIGVIVSPVAVMLLVTASLLPSDINVQLMPALQSTWLAIHVTMAALGSGAFLISFAAASMFLLTIPTRELSETCAVRKRIGATFILFWVAVPMLMALLLNLLDWLPTQVKSIEEARVMGLADQALTIFGLDSGAGRILIGRWAISLGIGMFVGAILWPLVYIRKRSDEDVSRAGSQFFTILVIGLLISAVIVGFLIRDGLITLTPQSYLKIFEFFGSVLVFSWFLTPLFYYLLVVLKGGWIAKLSLPRPVLEDISYTAVAIGYPLYSIGALFAGAIWAEQAWGTWWSWDPKETGALIIWLFYTGFLHARHNRQWKGERAAVLLVLGMVMLFVSFFGNYFFGGLHSFEVT